MTKPPKPMKDKAELKLEHLAPYLPYGLKMVVLKETIETLYKLSSYTNYATINGFVDINAIKPLLRPLSDLTKPIIHNGEKFVPMEKAGRTLDKTWLNNANANVEMQPYWFVQLLFEWKFDIGGLIDMDLAINVNTLSENPYK